MCVNVRNSLNLFHDLPLLSAFRFTNVGLQRLCEIFGLDLKGKRVCISKTEFNQTNYITLFDFY